MVDEDVAVPGLVEKGKLLTLTTKEALQWQVANARFDTLDELLSHLRVAHAGLVRVELNWAEALVRILTHPMMASLLFSVGMLALLAELLSPGFGIPGALGLTSLALFFGSHYLVGLAGWEEALLIGAGLLLLVAELLVFPDFGVAGVFGILALSAGVFLSVLGHVPTPHALWRAGTVLLAAFGLMAVGIVAILLLLPSVPAWSRLSLRARLGQQPAESAVEAEPSPSPAWLGVPGITLIPLRPTGVGLFQGQRLEITSEGEYIPAQTPVTVIRSEDNRLVVRQAMLPSP
jgi:membrane-bound serine protease (ClpP class)